MANNLTIYSECLKSYESFMRNCLDEKYQSSESYFIEAELERKHETAKDEAMSQVR